VIGLPDVNSLDLVFSRIMTDRRQTQLRIVNTAKHVCNVTESETAREGETCQKINKKTPDSATSDKDEDDGDMMLFTRRAVAVGDITSKRQFLHQRVRNWKLCPDSIDKVGIDKRPPIKCLVNREVY